jgi:hypothetical protein
MPVFRDLSRKRRPERSGADDEIVVFHVPSVSLIRPAVHVRFAGHTTDSLSWATAHANSPPIISGSITTCRYPLVTLILA